MFQECDKKQNKKLFADFFGLIFYVLIKHRSLKQPVLRCFIIQTYYVLASISQTVCREEGACKLQNNFGFKNFKQLSLKLYISY